VQRLREEGVLAKHGGSRSKITPYDLGEARSPKMNLADLGINPILAVAGVKLLTPEE
jgi:hypothetical protein